jgi:uncharacterized protein YcbX
MQRTHTAQRRVMAPAHMWTKSWDKVCAQCLFLFSPFLTGSIAALQSLVDVTRFRPNFVVSGTEPFAEDSWRSLSLTPHPTTTTSAAALTTAFDVVGASTRCVMVNIDQRTGVIHPALFQSLAVQRRKSGQIVFGVLLAHRSWHHTTTSQPQPVVVRVGDVLQPTA